MTYSIPERIFIVEACVQTSSIKETQQLFRDKYPLRSVPAKSSIQDLVRKWHTTGSIKNVTRNRTPSVRTPQLTARINEFMTRSPRKSTTRLAQQVHVSRRTCGHVLKCLKFKFKRRIITASFNKMGQHVTQQRGHLPVFFRCSPKKRL